MPDIGNGMDLFVLLRRIAGQRAIDIENVECHDAERLGEGLRWRVLRCRLEEVLQCLLKKGIFKEILVQDHFYRKY